MAREIKGVDAGCTLPAFLVKTEKYTAFISDLKGKILTCNNFFKEIYGIPDSTGWHIKHIFSSLETALFRRNAGMLSSTPVTAFETAVNGKTITWELSACEGPKQLLVCVGAVQQANNSCNINLEETHLSVFMDNSPALMWATDTQGRLVVINKKFKDVTGFSDNDLGKTLWQVYPKELADQYKRNDEKVVENGDLVEMEETSVDKFGRKRDFLVYKFPLHTADHGLVVAGWSVDITEHKNVHKRLLHQDNRFRQIARLQSHAVRRPLANILGLIDLIQYYAAQDDLQEVNQMVALLKESGNDLDSIIRKIVKKAAIFNPEQQ